MAARETRWAFKTAAVCNAAMGSLQPKVWQDIRINCQLAAETSMGQDLNASLGSIVKATYFGRSRATRLRLSSRGAHAELTRTAEGPDRTLT